jgi:succinate dehydrogenase / fumarate reductase cytochrome b subunit
MAQSVAVAFSQTWYATLYIISMILLGMHLQHGFQSAFQTIGWNNRKYMYTVRAIGTVFALLMAIGFASFPIMFHFDLLGISSNILPAK